MHPAISKSTTNTLMANLSKMTATKMHTTRIMMLERVIVGPKIW
jgi:hypothetical protein